MKPLAHRVRRTALVLPAVLGVAVASAAMAADVFNACSSNTTPASSSRTCRGRRALMAAGASVGGSDNRSPKWRVF